MINIHKQPKQKEGYIAVSNDKTQKITGSDKPLWIEPRLIQVDQLPTTFGSCSRGASEVPGDTNQCNKGKSAGITCNKGAYGAKL